MRAKVECFTAKDNGLVEVLHRPELLPLSGEFTCKVVQRHRSTRMSLRVKLKCFAVEAMIGPIEILHCTELLVPSGEINCKVGQKARSQRVLVFLWEKVGGFPVEDNGVIEVPHPPSWLYRVKRRSLRLSRFQKH